MKLFVTGDNHFGRKFNGYPAIKNKLVESRFACLENMVRTAEEEKCEFFVITGDLFDNTYSITKGDIKRVVEILSNFDQTVLVLPGNHDYYSEDVQLWIDFKKEIGTSNIVIMDEYRVYEFEGTDGPIDFYPAYCDSKHGDANRLDWIKEQSEVKKDRFNVGIAHGALEGLTIDTEGQYFPMSKTELNSIPMDIWLIGHAHVSYPDIPLGEENSSATIFNAGTHEQLEIKKGGGYAFVITLQNKSGIKRVLSKRIPTGTIRYFDDEIVFSAADNFNLEDEINKAVGDYSDNSIVRLTLSGSISPEDYADKEVIYEKTLGRFLDRTVMDYNLIEKITADKIDEEFSEIGFAARFLKELIGDPIELQMAYDVVYSVKG